MCYALCVFFFVIYYPMKYKLYLLWKGFFLTYLVLYCHFFTLNCENPVILQSLVVFSHVFLLSPMMLITSFCQL